MVGKFCFYFCNYKEGGSASFYFYSLPKQNQKGNPRTRSLINDGDAAGMDTREAIQFLRDKKALELYLEEMPETQLKSQTAIPVDAQSEEEIAEELAAQTARDARLNRLRNIENNKALLDKFKNNFELLCVGSKFSSDFFKPKMVEECFRKMPFRTIKTGDPTYKAMRDKLRIRMEVSLGIYQIHKSDALTQNLWHWSESILDLHLREMNELKAKRFQPVGKMAFLR